ncbi:hypothetical protein [Halegenticoccus tardaugens]|uniref:hypothetical protein n=1 Tax=Halegenticoccus tardaugens TaxID=2071624 RepID=UPI00100B8313|nr:hypothetical protein [Halegenticoccus tardaugens]
MIGNQPFWLAEGREALLQHTDQRVHETVDEKGFDIFVELLDRALMLNLTASHSDGSSKILVFIYAGIECITV